MAQPTRYKPAYSFTGYQRKFPLVPLPGDKLDENNVLLKETIDEICDNIALIQRDDGEVANRSIGLEQLKDELVGLAPGIGRATQALAEAGASNAVWMSPEATAQAAAAYLIPSRAVALTKSIPSVITSLRTSGYSSPGDGRGAAHYKKAPGAPPAGGDFPSLDGAVWGLDLGQPGLHVGMFGEIGGANASPAIQGMVDEVGYFRLPVGDLNIQDPITIPPHTDSLNALDTIISGQGPNKSILRGNGMAGASIFTPASLTGLYRFTMRDIGFRGDQDSAVDFTLTPGSNLLNRCLFENCIFTGVDGPGFRANSEFTLTFIRCDFSSTNHHSVELSGGNSTVLMNCYAFNCGDGYAGYRIYSHATLLECNGLDDTTGQSYWGWFGRDGLNLYQIKIIGGNAEDFRTAAIALEYAGNITFENMAMVAPASGNFETYIKILSGTAHRLFIDGNTKPVSKGATRTANSNISGTGGQPLVQNNAETGPGSFPDFYNTSQSLLYNVPNLQVRGGAFGRLDLQITSLKSTLEAGFVKPDITTITASATTFSVVGLNAVQTANTGATSLAQLTGGVDGQTVKLYINDANTTMKHNTGGAGRFILRGGVDENPVSGDVYIFECYGSLMKHVGGTTF